MYENIILKVGNRNFPNFSISSIGPIILRMMYNASDFTDLKLVMTAEFEDSLTRTKNNISLVDGTVNRINRSTD
ncbi:MAG: hypothetical protein Ta2E_13200 [Mycoplasmoidaceae bacterium]|nr:MAG: hypothetical protein Ta2E_13200 [Mycoplasmoidaceae bacterium]